MQNEPIDPGCVVDDPLADVSPEAGRLYDRLIVAGELPVTGKPEEAELLDARLIYFGGESDSLLRPVSRQHGLRVMLDRQLSDLRQRQDRLIDTWRRLSELPDAGAPATDYPSGVEPVPTLRQAATLAAELYGSARTLLRATHTASYSNQPTERRALVPAAGSKAVFLAIYDAEFARASWGEQIISESIRAGEQARVRTTVPTKMVHVDGRIALVAVRSDATGALLVTAPDLLALLAEWFDLLWHDSATSRLGSTDDAPLTVTQRRVLRLLAMGCSDKQIAHDCQITIRTVSRHVAAILAELGVDSRFAAGVAAVRRGWL